MTQVREIGYLVTCCFIIQGIGLDYILMVKEERAVISIVDHINFT